METENNAASSETVETTTETSSVDTPQVESQSTEQADTTSTEQSVSSDLGINDKEPEPENSESSLPSLDELVAEAMDGGLSEENLKLVEEAGLGKHLDMLVEGHRAIQEKNNNEIFSIAGSKEAYQELQEWSSNNLSTEEKEAVNAALFGGNMNLAKLAVQGLKAKYEAANGKAPMRVIEGGGTANEANRPFSDVSEYLKVTRTSQYKRDPEYRRQIEAKRNLSGF